MANQNSNNRNRITDDELNLARIYGIEDIMGNNDQNMDGFSGYNLNEIDADMPTNNSRNTSSNGNNMQSSQNGTMPQNGINSKNNMLTNQDQMENNTTPQPQRQEQTMPIARDFQNNGNLSNNNFTNMQNRGNIEEFLRTQIGKNVRMQFLIGTNTLIEKSGILMGVGDNFVILKEDGSGEILVCDFDGAKFIRFENNNR